MDQERETKGILDFRVLLYSVFLDRSEIKLRKIEQIPD